MKIIKCKDCKYWGSRERSSDDEDEIVNPIDPDTYERMEMPFEVKICGSLNITLFERNPNSNGVSLRDGSDYDCTMYTGEDFGCVNGEEK
jgi:hypothetical protein